MNEDIRKELYCLKCSLQFESRSVFDLHLKLLHKGENCSKVDNLAWKWFTKCEIGYQTQESAVHSTERVQTALTYGEKPVPKEPPSPVGRHRIRCTGRA